MAHSSLTIKISAAALAVPLLGAAAWAVIDDQAATEQAEQAEPARMDEQAIRVLDQYAKHLASLEAYSTTVKQSMNMQSSFGNESSEEEYLFAVAKPNQFALKSASQNDSESVISDGKNLYLYVPMFSSYVETDTPDGFSAMYEKVHNETVMFGNLPTSLLTPLFGPGGPDGELGDVTSATYVGEEELDGVGTHHLNLVIVPQFNEAGKKRIADEMGERASMAYYVDAWIGAGDEPRLHKVRLDLAKTLKGMMPDMFEQMPQMSDMQYEMTMAFADWKTGDDASKDHFAFTAPEGAEKHASMDEMMDAITESMAGPGGSPDELLGQQAPDFEMQTLDGGTFTNASHQGSDIIIMDFWATWCGPCIRAMPDLMAVAEQYKDRNVVLYAVNVQESEDDVKAFLNERNWTLNVPFDKDGSISRKFMVTGIPQTVVIDKDGTVQAVHVGYSPQIKDQLSGELDTLLRGEKLVTADDEE